MTRIEEIKLAERIRSARETMVESGSSSITKKLASELMEGDLLKCAKTGWWHEVGGVALYKVNAPRYERDSMLDWVYVDGAAYRLAALKRRFLNDGGKFLVKVKSE